LATAIIMNWIKKNFTDIDQQDWYNILKLRAETFVVEQFCPYNDLDGLDLVATHLYTKDNDTIVAYNRILKKGIAYEDAASIGRVLTHPNYRGQRYGITMLQEAIKHIYQNWGKVKVSIGAQGYLQNYYSKLGFENSSAMYLEDDIPHFKMDLNWEKAEAFLE